MYTVSSFSAKLLEACTGALYMPYAGRRGRGTRRAWSRIVHHDLIKLLLGLLGHEFPWQLT